MVGQNKSNIAFGRNAGPLARALRLIFANARSPLFYFCFHPFAHIGFEWTPKSNLTKTRAHFCVNSPANANRLARAQAAAALTRTGFKEPCCSFSPNGAKPPGLAASRFRT